jgi:long-chain acyl-CoA synthetase
VANVNVQLAADAAHEHVSAGLSSVSTLPALLERRIRKTPADQAYCRFDRHTGSWQSYSWQEFGQELQKWHAALTAENLSKGDRVAILMPSGIEHVAMDQAALARGLVPVPMHALDNPESIAYVLRDSGAAILLIDSVERLRAILRSGDNRPQLKRVVCAQAGAADLTSDARLIALEHWLGSKFDTPDTNRRVHVRPDDLAAIVYTSGTTGRPKGVMLSHENILSNVKAILKRLPYNCGDVFLSFLPLSHTLERTCGYYLPIAAGACVAFARSVKQLPEDLKHVRPTVLISVPRIYERIYARIMEKRATLGLVQRRIFDLAVAVGARRFDARQHGNRVSAFDRTAWPFLKRAVAAHVLEEFGGRLRIALSGGAPIGEAVIRFFLSLGIDVLQGYGMTESSPVVSVNTPQDNAYRSVGRPLDGIAVRLGENEELLVRGPNVMIGYWGRPEDTERVKEAGGWLHTGDQARIEDGRIFITGRIKDIIVTSTGEKIAPNDLENAILADPLFVHAMVVGENRPYLSVLAVLDEELWEQEKRGLMDKAVTEFLLKRIAQAVKSFPAYAMPRAVWWSTEPWTIDAGLLTPTLKNKRANIEARFAAEIEKLYARRPSV